MAICDTAIYCSALNKGIFMCSIVYFSGVRVTRFFPSILVKNISHNQLKKLALFFTFGHTNHPNFFLKSKYSGPIPVLRKHPYVIDVKLIYKRKVLKTISQEIIYSM